MNKTMKKLFFSCTQIRNFLYDYLEHNLSGITQFRFETHLKMCPECKEYFELYKAAANPNDYMESSPVPPELYDKTLHFLENEGILKKEE